MAIQLTQDASCHLVRSRLLVSTLAFPHIHHMARAWAFVACTAVFRFEYIVHVSEVHVNMDLALGVAPNSDVPWCIPS